MAPVRRLARADRVPVVGEGRGARGRHHGRDGVVARGGDDGAGCDFAAGNARDRELERLTIDKWTARYKEQMSPAYAELIYNGLWYSPLREAMDAFIDETQKRVTGNVIVKLYKGTMRILSRSSEYSLYDQALASYTSEDTFDHSAGEGFSKIFSLPLRTIARSKEKILSSVE